MEGPGTKRHLSPASGRNRMTGWIRSVSAVHKAVFRPSLSRISGSIDCCMGVVYVSQDHINSASGWANPSAGGTIFVLRRSFAKPWGNKRDIRFSIALVSQLRSAWSSAVCGILGSGELKLYLPTTGWIWNPGQRAGKQSTVP